MGTIHPAWALSLATLSGALVFVLLRPVHGFLWRGLRALRSSERVLIEDALKHLYDGEYHGTECSLMSLAGALGLSQNRAVELLERLEALRLVTSAGAVYHLSAEGRSEALRVIRVHRLWERYLAEETGLSPTEWHAEADRKEHALSAEEVEALAVSLGEPRFDPHGDPIPTRTGEIPPVRGKLLTELAGGEAAEIVHIEDEPEAVFAQLSAIGLHPGMRVRLLESTPRRLRFEADAEEHVLAPVVAANVTVMPLAAPAPEESFERLSGLDPGQEARVTGLSALCRGVERRRLLDLGVVPGTVVAAELRSPGGDPTAYRIRGAMIALRRAQADLIHIQRLEGAAS